MSLCGVHPEWTPESALQVSEAVLDQVYGVSIDEIDAFITNQSRETVEGHLADLIEADILTVYDHPPNQEIEGLPWQFYGFSEHSVAILGEFNYLKGVPMVKAIYRQIQKTETVERHQSAPRPTLPEAVRYAFRLDEDSDSDAESDGDSDDGGSGSGSGGSSYRNRQQGSGGSKPTRSSPGPKRFRRGDPSVVAMCCRESSNWQRPLCNSHSL